MTGVLADKQYYLSRLQDMSLERAKAILNKSLELNKLQNQNNKNQEQLFKEITGSDNKPKLFYLAALLSAVDTTYLIAIGLFNSGNYPINGCYIDFSEVYQKDTFNTVVKKEKIAPNNIAPRSSTYFYETRVPFLKIGKSYHYNINVHWGRESYSGILVIYNIVEKNSSLKNELKLLSENGFPLADHYFEINN